MTTTLREFLEAPKRRAGLEDRVRRVIRDPRATPLLSRELGEILQVISENHTLVAIIEDQSAELRKAEILRDLIIGEPHPEGLDVHDVVCGFEGVCAVEKKFADNGYCARETVPFFGANPPGFGASDTSDERGSDESH